MLATLPPIGQFTARPPSTPAPYQTNSLLPRCPFAPCRNLPNEATHTLERSLSSRFCQTNSHGRAGQGEA